MALQRDAAFPVRRRGRFLVTACLVAAAPWALPWRVTVKDGSLPSPVRIAQTASNPSYRLIDLGTLGGKTSDALAINDRGQVVGWATVSPRSRRGRAFLWEPTSGSGGAGAMRNLDDLHLYSRSQAYNINNDGQIIAASYNRYDYQNSFLYADEKQPLGRVPGYRYSRARDVNDRGEVVGSVQTGGRNGHSLVARAFLSIKGRMRDLGTLGGKYSHAYGINNRGQVVGKAGTGRDAQTHAFLWDNGAMRDLGTLPGGANSLACAINDRQQVVGFSHTGRGMRAFSWEGGVMRDLGTLPGGTFSRARAINNAGRIVGCSTFGKRDGEKHAVLWRGGEIIDLNRLLPPGSAWVLEEARAINEHGQIVGSGWLSGRRRAFLLSPIDQQTAAR